MPLTNMCVYCRKIIQRATWCIRLQIIIVVSLEFETNSKLDHLPI